MNRIFSSLVLCLALLTPLTVEAQDAGPTGPTPTVTSQVSDGGVAPAPLTSEVPVNSDGGVVATSDGGAAFVSGPTISTEPAVAEATDAELKTLTSTLSSSVESGNWGIAVGCVLLLLSWGVRRFKLWTNLGSNTTKFVLPVLSVVAVIGTSLGTVGAAQVAVNTFLAVVAAIVVFATGEPKPTTT